MKTDRAQSEATYRLRLEGEGPVLQLAPDCVEIHRKGLTLWLPLHEDRPAPSSQIEALATSTLTDLAKDGATRTRAMLVATLELLGEHDVVTHRWTAMVKPSFRHSLQVEKGSEMDAVEQIVFRTLERPMYVHAYTPSLRDAPPIARHLRKV